MRKDRGWPLVVLGLWLAAWAGRADAQEVWSVSGSAPQAARVTRGVTVTNAATCLRLSTVAVPLTATCTQAQACTNAGAAGGAACTAAQARTANARIYPNTQPGREEFLTFTIVARGVTDLLNNAVALDQQQFCAFFKAASAANQNSACTVVGYTAGCEPCP